MWRYEPKIQARTLTTKNNSYKKIYNKLRHTYLVPASLTYMKELKLMIDNMEKKNAQ